MKTASPKHPDKVHHRAARNKPSGRSGAIGSKQRFNGKILGSDLLLAQEDLRWSERRYRKILEQSKDGILVLDAEQHHILDLNNSLASMFGYTRDELLTRPIIDIWPDKLYQVVDLARSVIAGTRVTGADLACKTRNGNPIRIAISASFIDFDSMPSILCIVRDNTERKQAEEALKESEGRLKTLSEAAFEGIVITCQGKILDANKASSSILGYRHEELIGKEVLGFVAPEDKDLVSEHFQSGSDESYEHRVVRKDGSLIHVEVRPSTIHYRGQSARMTAIRDITKRKQTEIERRKLQEKLQQSESMLTSIVKAIPDIVYRLDPEGKITFVSDAVRRYGYDPEELLGMDILDLVHPEDNEIAARSINERRTGERRTKDLEIRLFSKAHTLISFDVRDSIVEPPVFSVDAEGQYECADCGADIFVGTQGVARDITRRKRANEEIQKLSLAVEQSPASVMITDINGTIEYVNPAFLNLTGYTSEEVLGQNPRILNSGVQSKEFYDDLWAAIAAGKEWRGEFCNKKKSGEHYWELATISPVLDTTGRIKNYLAIKEDITQRKQAEEALRKSEERFRSFFEHAPEYCYMVDPEGTIMDVNQAATEALGYTKNELIGRPLKSLYTPDSQKKAKLLFDKWLETGELVNEELIIVTKTGDHRHILLSTGTVTDDCGNLMHSISIQKDITELKQAQEHMARTAKLSALGQLAAGIAHEVNNPLNTILLAMDNALYQDDNLSSNIRRMLTTSKEAAIRAGKIVANILEFARERPMHRDLCNLHDLIDKVVTISSTDALRVKVTIQREYMTDAPQLELDAIQIQQVFMNMTINAIQAMPEGGSLLIRTRLVDDGSKIAVEFTDTGAGIPENTKAKIFDPFYTTKSEGAGTGLGLSISYGLVEAHGGEIKVNSKVGEGTTFTVLFPTDYSEVQNHSANPLKAEQQ